MPVSTSVDDPAPAFYPSYYIYYPCVFEVCMHPPAAMLTLIGKTALLLNAGTSSITLVKARKQGNDWQSNCETK